MSIQKEDVYETEDVPSPKRADSEERFESTDIEKMHVDIDGAMKLFGNRILNADDVDFSDSLARKKRRGYRSGNYVLEIVGTESSEPETLAQKFSRIRFELEELTEAVNKEQEGKKDTNFIGISKADLDSVNDLLRAATLKSEGKSPTIGAAPPAKAASTDGELPKGASMAKNIPDSLELRSLDERIRHIEGAVIGGGGRSAQRSHHEPLAETIENLRVQVESLNPSYLDGVAGQLKAAITKLAEFDDKRKKITTDDFEEKINDLHKLIVQWDATCANVPSIVKRLHSLSKLHEQAQEFASKLNDMTALKEHLEKKTDNQKLMLYELKRESAQVVGELTKKVAKLEERLAAI